MKKYLCLLSVLVTSAALAEEPKKIKCLSRASDGYHSIPFDQVETFDAVVRSIEVSPVKSDLRGFSPSVRINGVMVSFTACVYLAEDSVECARLSRIGTQFGPIEVNYGNQIPKLEIRSISNSEKFVDGSLQGVFGAKMDLRCRAN